MCDDGQPSVDETTDYVRRIEAESDAGAVTLLGVVHGHPASSYRVQRQIEGEEPDIVALELPSLATSLAAVRARDTATPPRKGGEMSAAVQSADASRVEGIDAPSLAYLGQLFRYCREEKPERGTLRGVVTDVVRSTVQALKWRAAATIEGRLGVDLSVGHADDHGVDYDDSLEAIVENEARHVSITRTFRNAVRTPASVEVIDTIRERAMADRLDRLRSDGDVVAVVGLSHLDAVSAQLRS